LRERRGRVVDSVPATANGSSEMLSTLGSA
jgi:hypothetical protein